MSYTAKEHRYRSVLAGLWTILARKPRGDLEMKTIEKYTSSNTVNDFFELIGLSHNIAIYTPENTDPLIIGSKL